MRIDVTFEIDTDGIVKVTARDQETGEQASTTITLSSGLSEEQIEEMIEDDVAGRVVTADAPPAPVPARVAAPAQVRLREAPIPTPAAKAIAPAPVQRPVAAAPVAVPAVDLDELDGLDDLDLGGDLEVLEEDLPRQGAGPSEAAAEIDLETEVPNGVDEDGFFDRSGNDLSIPNPDEDLG